MGLEYPWQDESWLREQYVEQDKSINEIADEQDSNVSTIYKWLKRSDITVQSKKLNDDHPANDPDLLKELHHEKGLSVNAISNRLDVGRSTVKRRFEKYGIKREYKRGKKCVDVPIRTSEKGYERFANNLRVHKLVACLDNDPKMVFGNREVHHKNGIPWDNRPENLEVLTRQEHANRHRNDPYGNKPYQDKSTLKSLYYGEDMSMAEIAESYGVTPNAIGYWMKKHEMRPNAD